MGWPSWRAAEGASGKDQGGEICALPYAPRGGKRIDDDEMLGTSIRQQGYFDQYLEFITHYFTYTLF